MKLFELRACWEEYYDCPDEGRTKVCDTYETIAFSVDDDAHLKVVAEDLTAGFEGNCWSERRANRLSGLYPGYDWFCNARFVIVEVTDLIHTPNAGAQPPKEGDKLRNEVASTDLLGADDETCRGFWLVKFRDEYDKECSLQISSRAVCENEDGTVDDPKGWIWLGIDDAEPKIMKTKARKLGMELPPGEVSGWMPYPVQDDVLLTTRMHLNEAQVRGLIARMQTWLDTGGFRTPNAEAQRPEGCADAPQKQKGTE